MVVAGVVASVDAGPSRQDTTAANMGWTCAQNTWDPPPPEGTKHCDVPEAPFDVEEEEEEEEGGDAPSQWPPLEWVNGLKCDARDEYGMWYKAKVVKVGAAGTKDAGHVLIHYNGWASKHDEWVSVCCCKLRLSLRPSLPPPARGPFTCLDPIRPTCGISVTQ